MITFADKILRPSKFFLGSYLFIIVLLFLYSFTQIDLGLTMTRASFFTQIQKSFQYIGYFNRPLSASIFGVFIIVLFFFYRAFLWMASHKKISRRTVWLVILITTGILTLSYNAFSYDIFNYIFDAKIFTHYHLNPYQFKALDFPSDPMLSFMHWTHRIYPYGPVWLVLTIPLSYLGMNFFLPTFFLFKLLMATSFLSSVWVIGKIMQKIKPEEEVSSLVLFGLNPLVLIESLVSGHNDIVMMFFCLFGLYLFIRKRFLVAFLLVLISVGIKFATGLLLPLLFFIYFASRKKIKFEWQTVFSTFIVAMLFAVILASLRTTFQPWYLLYLLPFAAFIPRRYFIVIPTIILSLTALLNYLPFLYSGNWDAPIPTILNWINVAGIFLALVSCGLYKLRIKRKKT